MKTIDYSIIADAVNYYSAKGYKYIEVPWLVSGKSIEPTHPLERCKYQVNDDKYLVGSGEQSFIEIMKTLPNGELGKYQCVTPCFRDEPALTLLNREFFLKNELIWILDPKKSDDENYVEKCCAKVLEDAGKFFERFVESQKIILKNTDEGWDYFLYDQEIGSYGVRRYNGFIWIYGTGCAEPRFSQILELKGN